MKNISFILIIVISLFGLMIPGIPAVAYDPDDKSDNYEDFIVPPLDETTPEKIDPRLINVLDSKNPNYDSGLIYGPEGTRFGPPGKRTPITNIPSLSEQQELGLMEKDDHKNWGTFLPYNPNIYGVRAVQAVYDNIVLNEDGDTLYAPTMLGPNRCPLELTTCYRRYGSGTYRWVEVWDFHVGQFVVGYTIDAYFMANYVRLGHYFGAIKYDPVSGRWAAWLFNYSTYTWTVMPWYSSSQDHDTDGWDMWEEYRLDNNWPTLPIIQSKNLNVKIGSTGDLWKVVTAASGYGNDGGMTLGDAPYPYYFVMNYYYWRVGPGPQ